MLETVPGLEHVDVVRDRAARDLPRPEARRARRPAIARRVTEQNVPYIRPQENGGHADVRWLELTDDAGQRSAASRFDAPAQVSATHHRAADLAAATHHVELVPRPETIVHLDVAHRGLGTASCGPDTLPGYLVGPGTYRWSWTLRRRWSPT